MPFTPPAKATIAAINPSVSLPLTSPSSTIPAICLAGAATALKA